MEKPLSLFSPDVGTPANVAVAAKDTDHFGDSGPIEVPRQDCECAVSPWVSRYMRIVCSLDECSLERLPGRDPDLLPDAEEPSLVEITLRDGRFHFGEVRRKGPFCSRYRGVEAFEVVVFNNPSV